jgi:hypothetical protein
VWESISILTTPAASICTESKRDRFRGDAAIGVRPLATIRMSKTTRKLLMLAASALVLVSLGCGDPHPNSDFEGQRGEQVPSEPPKVIDMKAKWRAEGRAEAEQDLSAGKLRLKVYGLPAPWSRKYHESARKQRGVELVGVAGCLVSQELEERVAGYNEPMQQEIDRRFGPGALEELAATARAEYEKQEAARNAKP